MRSTAFFLLILFSLQARAGTLRVCADCPYRAIKPAIEAAFHGDVIQIADGPYREGQIIIDKRVSLIGIDFPVLDGEGETEILTIVADSVLIEGLRIQHVGTSYLEDRAGIRIRRSSHFTIRGNQLYDTFFGIYLEHSNDGLIADNHIEGEAVEEMSSGNAIHCWYSKRLRIEGNTVRQHRDGIYLEFVDFSTVRNNISEDNLRYGLHFMFSNDDGYKGNTFRRNGAGVAVMFSSRITMFGNHFVQNWGKSSYGLLLKEINDAEIRDNRFQENTVGIYVEGSNRIDYVSNEFRSNGWALRIAGGCLDNVIRGNDFVANTFELSIFSAPGQNVISGNYWSEYSGYDLDRDGVGDVPHRPVKLFNYVVDRTPESIVLLRSTFVDLLNFTEKVSPVFTPENVADDSPCMRPCRNSP